MPVALFFHGMEQAIDDLCVRSNHHKASTFSEVAECFENNFDDFLLGMTSEAMRHHKRAISLTSDDGYAHTLTNAARKAKSHRCGSGAAWSTNGRRSAVKHDES